MKITINRAQVQAKVMGAWEKGLPLLSEAVLNDWTAYTDVNPNASWQWCEVAKTRHKKQWAEQAQRLMEMNL